MPKTHRRSTLDAIGIGQHLQTIYISTLCYFYISSCFYIFFQTLLAHLLLLQQSNQKNLHNPENHVKSWQWSTPTQYLSTLCYFYISTLFYIFSDNVWLLSIFGARFIIAIILHGHYSLMDLIKFLSWQYCTARQEQQQQSNQYQGIFSNRFASFSLTFLPQVFPFFIFMQACHCT